MKKELKFLKKINVIPIFASFIFAGVLGITAINNDNHYDGNHSNDLQIRSNEGMNENEKFTQVSMGEEHSSALTNEGDLYVWGSSPNGQLGTGIERDTKSRPWKITDNFNLNENEKITQLSMGWHHSSALTSEGNAYAWGRNRWGEIGNSSSSSAPVTSPVKITEDFKLDWGDKIIQVDMGGEHSLGLTSQGNVYAWGRNSNGQLGNGTTSGKGWPFKITDKFSLGGGEKITSLSIGRNHSSALTNKGKVFTWGYNEFGQLGNNTTTKSTAPTNITDKFNLQDGETITKLNMGWDHSSALTSEGNLYTWGKNTNGQLGDGSWVNKPTPTKITEKFNLDEGETLTQTGMGGDGSSALTSKGNVYTWGHNNHGQLGDGSSASKNSPTKITEKFELPDNEKISQLSFNTSHSSAVTDKGNVYTWGLNNGLNLLGRSGDLVDSNLPGVIDFTLHSEILSDSISITDITLDSVKINFNVTKNDYDANNGQDGDVVVRDGDGNPKGNKDNVNGPDSITIDNLKTGTTFTGWTIEVDGNGKIPIEDFATLKKSELVLKDLDLTYNSVTINFDVTKNDQDGNVVVRDGAGIKKGNKDNVNGPDSITIDNLEPGTTFTGWTIEVDGNDKKLIEDFTTLKKSELVLKDLDLTYNSVTINFEVAKNGQDGNVVVRDGAGIQKGNKDNVNGPDSITINNLEPGTTFTGWTIEVDDNDKVPIDDFTTLKKSELVLKDLDLTYNSVTINFDVAKNGQDGNVIVRDGAGIQKGNEDNVNGPGSITIDNLEPGTTFIGWTIEVDDNDKIPIEDFTTLKKSELVLKDLDLTYNSVTINFEVSKNGQDGNVVVRDGAGIQKGNEDNVNGPGSITIDNLEPGTTFTGWTIEVDDNDKIKIPDFKIHLYESEVVFNNISNITPNSVTINFNVTKNYEDGNVVVRDGAGIQKGNKDNVNGPGSITINNLEPGTTFIGWTIEVDGHDKVPIKDFKTKDYTSDYIEEYIDIKVEGEIKYSDKEITLIYSINEQLEKGEIRHIISYKDGSTQSLYLSDEYSTINPTKKTYKLNQTVKNIKEINTIYKINNREISLESHTGTPDKVLGIKNKKGISLGMIIGISLVSIAGIVLIAVIIYYFVHKNKNKNKTNIESI